MFSMDKTSGNAKRWGVALLTVAALLLAACVPVTPVAPEGDVPPATTPTPSPATEVESGETDAAGLAGVTWQLVEYLNAADTMAAPTADATSRLT
jgi:hypothetical protein